MPVSGIEFTSLNRITDSATARTWASGFKSAFISAGMTVHPSDTGQTLASTLIYSGSVITSESVGGTRGTGTFSPLTSDAGLGGTGLPWSNAAGLSVPYTTAAGRAIINTLSAAPLSYYLDSGGTDHRIDATVYTSGNASYYSGLYCKFVDQSNFVFAYVNGFGLVAYGYRAAGVDTTQVTASGYFASGDQLSIQVQSSTAYFFKNGVQFGTSSIPVGLAAGTKVGFIGGNLASTGVDEIVVSGALGSTLNMGYEMFKLPQPAGTQELYLKAEYMGNTNNVSYPKLRLSVGRWVSNGTLSVHQTNPTPAPTAIDVWTNLAYENTTRSCWIAGDASGFVLVHAWDATNALLKTVYAFDRHRNISGVGTTDGWSVMRAYSGGNGKNVLNYDPYNGVEAASTVWPCVTPGNVTTLVSSRNAAGATNLYPVIQSNALGSANSKMLLGYNISDVPGNTIFTATHLGAPRLYRCLPAITGLSAANESGIANAVWWGD